MNVGRIWHTLFLIERPTIGLSFFRMFVALTTGLHVIPSFFHLQDNYLAGALKSYNYIFFPASFVEWVQASPDGLVVVFVVAFCLTCFTFFIGLFSQVSCILMTACCYYFYALNDFHIGTLSWDILLVTLFLMCLTNYHSDYFSVDALRRGDVNAYKKPRPFFLQRLLQIQLASTFFYTALYKISSQGNWLSGNPLYYLMNYPPSGVTKNFLLKEFLGNHPSLCYGIGVLIIAMELSMPFFLFNPRTRRSAIAMGLIFHLLLVLTLDVPAIFLFLFPAQMLLFINPDHIIQWVEYRRRTHARSARAQIIYDADCGFCRASIERVKVMDLFGRLDYVPGPKGLNEMRLVLPEGQSYGGFYAFRRLCFLLPMLYPLLLVAYFPLMGIIGNMVYKIVAKNRYVFPFRHSCLSGHCGVK
jgi:predicted DCC family thiol-disulfide oxidoreductase YuxK